MCLKELFKPTVDLPSPSDIVKKVNIIHYQTTNVIEVSLGNLSIPFTKPPKVWISEIPGTKSMDPVFDKEHNNIYIAGADPDNQKILVEWLAKEWFEKQHANIIIYRTPQIYAVHRLSKIKNATAERLWFFKGDNNAIEDPYPAKDEHIQWVLIGTIY